MNLSFNLKIYREDIDLINKAHSFGLRIVLDISKNFLSTKEVPQQESLFFYQFFIVVRNFIWFDNLNNFADVKKILINMYLYTQIRIKNYKGRVPFFVAAISMNLIFLYALFLWIYTRNYKTSNPTRIHYHLRLLILKLF